MSYKITTITTERGITLDGRTFTTSADLCDSNRQRIEFADLSNAELFASAWAARNGAEYLAIGDSSDRALNCQPEVGEVFVEVRCA